jgi:flagellar motor switch protein FliN/FliY
LSRHLGTNQWLNDTLTVGLVQAFEAMAGRRPEAHLEESVSPSSAVLTLRRQRFTGIPGAAWIGAAEPDWTVAGREVLRAAGIEDGDAAAIKSTYLETIGQAFSMFADSIGKRLGKEVTCEGADEAAAPTDLPWTLLRLTFGSTKIHLYLAFQQELVNSSSTGAPQTTAAVVSTKDTEEAAPSKTFDLLLDVEMPVSVSFGRAQVALKDLIKLTTGSIVELNRSIAEPVEVIVNNCVIARGEVVVVEGNFGVRIQQVVSRQERLRTLT